MAPKREKSLLEDPPAASSSEDEEVEEEEEEEVEDEEEVEEEEDDEEEEEEDDDEEEEAKGKPNSSSAVKKPLSDLTPNLGSKPQIPSSDDEEEEEDESEESDSEPIPSKVKPLVPSRGSNPNGGKPIASQPKKTVSKPSTTATTPLASSPTKPSVTGKRPLESEKDSKRKKKKVDDEDEEDSHPEESEKRSPKNIFQRLWSEDDEIVILRGMVESLKKGVKPLSDRSEFLESIKNSLHVEVSQDQLTNKIRRLKKKYLNNFKRGKGGDPVFSKSHDVLSYELMKEIWGAKEGEIRGGETSNGKLDSVVANGKSSKSKKSNNAVIPVRTKTLSLSDISMRESSKLDGSNGSLHPCVQEMVHSRNNMNMVGGSFLTQGLSLIGDSKTKELEQKWRSLYAAELQLYLRRVELVQEQTIAIVDAFKSSEEH